MKYSLPFLLLLTYNAFAGDIDFSWLTTTHRADDTPLAKEEIGGYKIYWKLSSDVDYTSFFDVTNGFHTSVTLPFPDGDYTAAMTTYDQHGRESVYSTEVTFTSGAGLPPPVVIFPPKATQGVTATPVI